MNDQYPRHPLECQLELQAAVNVHNVMRDRALRAEAKLKAIKLLLERDDLAIVSKEDVEDILDGEAEAEAEP